MEEGDALLGTWVLDGKGEDVVSPATAFRDRIPAADLIVSDGRFSDLGVSMVRDSDVTVALVGEHRSRSGEDRCISTLKLPAGQMEVLEEMAAIGKPLVVVVFTRAAAGARPGARAGRVRWSSPGTPGSRRARPSPTCCSEGPRRAGACPMTFPRSVGHIPSSSLERPTGRRVNRDDDRKLGRYLNALVFPELTFGYGLTYTSFEYGELSLSRHAMPVGSGSLKASLEVTNTGSRPGREVVQLYLRDHVAAVTRPIVELADWQAVDIEPGQTATVTFRVTAEMFGYYDREMQWRVDPGEVDVIVGPNAAYGTRARVTLID